MFFGFQLTLGLMMVFYGYSVMKNPRVWGDQGRRAVKAEHFEEYCRRCTPAHPGRWRLKGPDYRSYAPSSF